MKKYVIATIFLALVALASVFLILRSGTLPASTGSEKSRSASGSEVTRSFGPAPTGASSPARSTTVEQPPTTEPTPDERYQLSGRINLVNVPGAPEIPILIRRLGSAGQTLDSSTTTAREEFSLELAAGRYRVSFHSHGYYGSSKEVTLDQDRQVALTVEPIEGDYHAGLVVDRQGKPLSSVRVTGTWGGPTGTNSTFTNANGEFILAVDPSSPLTLAVKASGFRDFSIRGQLDELPYELVMDRGATLSVTLLVDESTSLDRVTFSLASDGGAQSYLPRLGADLTAELAGLTAGTFELRVFPEGLPMSPPIRVDLVNEERTEVTVPVSRTGLPTSIRVTDLAGNPIPDAMVEISRRARRLSLFDLGQTDGNGVFLTHSVGAEPFTVVAMAPGFLNAVRHEDRAGLADGTSVVPMERGSTLTLSFLDPSGDPAENVLVQFDEQGGLRLLPSDDWGDKFTDAGSVEFQSVPSGIHAVSYYWKGQKINFTVEVEPETDQRLRIQVPSLAITGSLNVGGTSLGKIAALRVDGPSDSEFVATLDEEKRFELLLPSPGKYQFSYRNRRTSHVISWRRVVSGNDHLTLGQDLVAVRGRFLHPDGGPIFQLRLRLEGPRGTFRMTTDRSGEVFYPNVRTGDYTWRFENAPAHYDDSPRSLEVVADVTTEYQFQRR